MSIDNGTPVKKKNIYIMNVGGYCELFWIGCKKG